MRERPRVLAIRLDTIGDVIMTTPALGALADNGAQVTLLTSTFATSLKPMMPYVHDLVALDVPWMKPSERYREPLDNHLSVLTELRERDYDLAIVFTVSTQDPSCPAYLGYLVGARRVAAYARGRLYGLITDPVADSDEFPPSRHEVTRQLELVSALGFRARNSDLRLSVPRPSPSVRSLLDHLGTENWCVVHPGATAPSRRYPNDQWARVIDVLQRVGTRVVLAGGKQDRLRGEEISALCEVEPLRADARLGLPELAALIRAAPVAATCNSAAAHLAAAVGTPVVTLYAGTNPQHTPWAPHATVLRRHTECTWCLSSTCRLGEPRCISSIAPSTVAEAILRAVTSRHSSAETIPLAADSARPRAIADPGP